MASAMWVPPDELKVFRVASFQSVADVGQKHTVNRMVVAEFYFDANDEVHLLPAQVIARSICDVGFCGGLSSEDVRQRRSLDVPYCQ